MFDHVGIAVSDLAASERFYRTVLSALGVEPSHADAELVEWDDWDIGPDGPRAPRDPRAARRLPRPVPRGRGRFWQAGIDAGYRDDGEPGPRTVYGPDYYGAFLLDPDGNSAEAVHGERADPVPDGRVDHLWIRVARPRGVQALLHDDRPARRARAGRRRAGPRAAQRARTTASHSSTTSGRSPSMSTSPSPRGDDATVRAFHAAALAAGYEDHGAPGERAVYHPGYYGAFVLDPDGHNIEVVNHNR